jgi:L-lysine 2,3-aminomutase
MAQHKKSSGILTKPEALLEYLGLSVDAYGLDTVALTGFSFRVPMSFVARMEKGNPRDPLLMQVLPRVFSAPTAFSSQFGVDPVSDQRYQVMPGVIHKYPNRVLLVTTGACAVHCRYCFRQAFPYENGLLQSSYWQKVLAYLKDQPQVDEVILSGGDPLVVAGDKLQRAVEMLSDIPHLKYLRIHSRQPIVDPHSITTDVINGLAGVRLKTLLVVHVNHPNELDSDVYQHLLLWRQAGILLLNQTVLLKEINDSLSILKQLSHRLYECHVLPYYLHQLDKVKGSEVFWVPKARSRQLLAQLKAELPGFLVPTLVKDEGGAEGKNWLI